MGLLGKTCKPALQNLIKQKMEDRDILSYVGIRVDFDLKDEPAISTSYGFLFLYFVVYTMLDTYFFFMF